MIKEFKGELVYNQEVHSPTFDHAHRHIANFELHRLIDISLI